MGGINWDAFAGGLATGFEKGTHIADRLEQRRLQEEKLMAEQRKLAVEADNQFAKRLMDANHEMVQQNANLLKAKDVNEWNTIADGIGSIKNTLLAGVNPDNLSNNQRAMLSKVDLSPVEKLIIVDAYDATTKSMKKINVPESFAQAEGRLAVLGDGTLGLAGIRNDGSVDYGNILPTGGGIRPKEFASTVKQPTAYTTKKFEEYSQAEQNELGKKGYRAGDNIPLVTVNQLMTQPPAGYEQEAIKIAARVKNIEDVMNTSSAILSGELPYSQKVANKITAKFLVSEDSKTPEMQAKIKDFNTAKNAIPVAERVITEFEKAASKNDFSKNPLSDTALNIIMQYTPEEWGILDKAEKDKALSRLRAEGLSGMLVASVLLANSGQSASEKEALRTAQYVFGGGTASNISVRLSNSKSFLEEKKNELIDKATDLFSKGYQRDTGEILFGKGLKKQSAPYPTNVPTFEEVKAKYPNITIEEYNKRVGGK